MNIKHLIAVAILFFITTLKAQNWTGNVNSDWNNSGNWTSWPLTGEDITIDPAAYTGAAASPVISANSVFTPAGMIVQNGATLTVQANLTTTKRIELLNTGTLLTVSSGTLFASGSGSRGRFIVSDGAAVVQNNGTVRASQRVIVELGGIYTLNNGTVNPAEELAIGDGNALGSSLFDMNGGTLTMGQGLGFENEAGLYYPTFDMSGGTLSVGSDITWLGVTPGAGTPRFIMSGGQGTVAGSIFNDPATTVDLYVKIIGTASLTVNGPAMTLVNATDSVKQSGNSRLTFSNTNSITNPGVWFADGGTVVFNGNATLQGTGSYQMNDVTINATRSLQHVSPALLTLVGNLINHGTFTANANTVAFAGNAAQSIGGNAFTSFRNLTLANTSSSGLTLNKGVTVTGALQLNNGLLNSSSANLITLSDNATSSSGSANSFVNGPLKKIGNDPFVFPLGKNNRWRRMAISAPSSVGSEFTGEYFDGAYPNLTPVNAPLQSVTTIEYWKLDRMNSADAIQPSFYWEHAQASAITTCSLLSIAYWNGSSWAYTPSTATGSCSGSGAGSLQNNTATGNFGIFTFGFTGLVTTQNITLCHNNSITIGANTYTTSGTYVDVLTAVDNSDSTVVTHLNILPVIVKNQAVSFCNGQVLSVGTATYNVSGSYTHTLTSVQGCDSIVNTTLTIKAPVNVSVLQNNIVLSSSNSGASSYQWGSCLAGFTPLSGQTAQSFTASANGSYAVVVTENGCSDTSACFNVISVSITEQQASPLWSVYPNPNNGKIIVKTENEGAFYLRILDVAGRAVVSQVLSGPEQELDYADCENGVYFLEITQGTSRSVLKLIRH